MNTKAGDLSIVSAIVAGALWLVLAPSPVWGISGSGRRLCAIAGL